MLSLAGGGTEVRRPPCVIKISAFISGRVVFVVRGRTVLYIRRCILRMCRVSHVGSPTLIAIPIVVPTVCVLY